MNNNMLYNIPDEAKALELDNDVASTNTRTKITKAFVIFIILLLILL